MFTQPYDLAIEKVGELSPSLDNPTKFINWAEDIAQVISFIYSKDYEDVTVDIVNASKTAQDYED